MICLKCGGKLRAEASYSLPGGAVRRRRCAGCKAVYYTKELIQEDGAFFNKVASRYQKSLGFEKIKARFNRRDENGNEKL